MKNENEYNPDYAVPPGVTIRRLAGDVDIEGWFYKDLGLRRELVNDLMVGKMPMNVKIADSLERLTDVSASFWLRREEMYQNRIKQLRKDKK